MDKPTVERGVETKFFRRHKRHIPAVLNLEKKKDKNKEIAEDLEKKL